MPEGWWRGGAEKEEEKEKKRIDLRSVARELIPFDF